MRQSRIERQTSETSIAIELDLDGGGTNQIHTGIGFFDHMLTHISKHSLINLKVEAIGDLYIDGHHTVEDVGIVFGSALILCAIDLSGRPYLEMEAHFKGDQVGTFDTQLVEAFFRAVAVSAGMNLHLQVLKGRNDHHIIEGMCKAFAKALGQAVSLNVRKVGIPSTKGTLEG